MIVYFGAVSYHREILSALLTQKILTSRLQKMNPSIQLYFDLQSPYSYITFYTLQVSTHSVSENHGLFLSTIINAML